MLNMLLKQDSSYQPHLKVLRRSPLVASLMFNSHCLEGLPCPFSLYCGLN